MVPLQQSGHALSMSAEKNDYYLSCQEKRLFLIKKKKKNKIEKKKRETAFRNDQRLDRDCHETAGERRRERLTVAMLMSITHRPRRRKVSDCRLTMGNIVKA